MKKKTIFISKKYDKKEKNEEETINRKNTKNLNKKIKRDKKENEIKNGNNNIEKSQNSNNPQSLKEFINLTEDSQSYFSFDNTFCVFNSINDILYLIYSNKNSILSYNLIDNKKINEIKNANPEKQFITNFRHHLDSINNRDLLISISAWGNNIKLWNVNNWECLNNFEHIYSNGYLYSACFLDDNNDILILTSNYNKNYFVNYAEYIKIFSLNGSYYNLSNSGESTFSIDVYYDKNLKKNFIITGNKDCVNSYVFIENKLYHKYSSNGHFFNEFHYCTIVINSDKIIKLLESSGHGAIRIWNFHSGKMLKKIQINKSCKLFGICIWDDRHIFVGGEDNKIKLIDIKKGEVINGLIGHDNWVLTIKKIMHPKYGECLF